MSYWGCKPHSWNCVERKCISTVITDNKNQVIFPSVSSIDDDGFYDLPGFYHDDDLLIFKPSWLSKQVTKYEEFRIWYGADLVDKYESSGDGRHCVKVDISYFE